MVIPMIVLGGAVLWLLGKILSIVAHPIAALLNLIQFIAFVVFCITGWQAYLSPAAYGTSDPGTVALFWISLVVWIGIGALRA